MKNTGVKFLISMMLLVQVMAPVEAAMSVEMTLAGVESDHCQLVSAVTKHGSAMASHKPCVAHCMTDDKTASVNNGSSCGADSSCTSNCVDCSHSNLMILNDLVLMHQAASHSPLQTSYDTYKYYPSLKLRPPRV